MYHTRSRKVTRKYHNTFISYRQQSEDDTGFYQVNMFFDFFQKLQQSILTKKKNYTTKFTDESLSTLILSPNTGLSPMARKTPSFHVFSTQIIEQFQTVENKPTKVLLITIAGTCITTLLLVAIGFQLRSRIILCRRESDHQQNMFFENGNVYAEANNLH